MALMTVHRESFHHIVLWTTSKAHHDLCAQLTNLAWFPRFQHRQKYLSSQRVCTMHLLWKKQRMMMPQTVTCKGCPMSPCEIVSALLQPKRPHANADAHMPHCRAQPFCPSSLQCSCVRRRQPGRLQQMQGRGMSGWAPEPPARAPTAAAAAWPGQAPSHPQPTRNSPGSQPTAAACRAEQVPPAPATSSSEALTRSMHRGGSLPVQAASRFRPHICRESSRCCCCCWRLRSSSDLVLTY